VIRDIRKKLDAPVSEPGKKGISNKRMKAVKTHGK
jgi:hypothetical protein